MAGERGSILISTANKIGNTLVKKLGGTGYTPSEWADKINLLGKLPEDTASGSIANFPDGADDVPVAELIANIVPKQAGTGDPAPDNVRAISGYTGMNIYKQGKNLLLPENSDLEPLTTNGISRSYSLANQTFTLSGTNTKTDASWLIFSGSNMIVDGLKKGVQYRFSHNLSSDLYSQITYYDTNNTLKLLAYVLGNSSRNASTTFTVPNDFDHLGRFQIGVNKTASTIQETAIFQIESGSSATAFEAYTAPEVKTVSFGDAGVVYGGSLNVTTGGLNSSYKLTNLSGFTWEYDSTTYAFGIFQTTGNISDKAANKNFICEIYKNAGNYRGTLADKEIGVFNNTTGLRRICIRDDSLTSLQDFESAIIGKKIAYEITTPETYQLTPEEVKTLLGVNNIYADTGDTEVTYRADVDLYIEKIGG